MAGKLSKKLNTVGDLLSAKYKTVDIDDETCFILPDGQVARLLTLFGDIGLEYADSLDMAKEGLWGEDGYLYDGELPAEEIAQLLVQEAESDE